ncbi:hypothetical protein L3X38_006273 [Prunus dulcis]|uniref:Uncharacterized protein n=1 Tax=Prunus dulcis TaxID=3755 RepID=A0AAD4ZSD3_PRUDU|nr:hypothetical protein L3X38_006273 [Prunus dulcis]
MSKPKFINLLNPTLASFPKEEEAKFASPAHEGVLVTKIRRLLLALSSCVRFVPHTANTVAHRIARYSLRAEELCYWLGDGPPWLLDDVREDWSHFV